MSAPIKLTIKPETLPKVSSPEAPKKGHKIVLREISPEESRITPEPQLLFTTGQEENAAKICASCKDQEERFQKSLLDVQQKFLAQLAGVYQTVLKENGFPEEGFRADKLVRYSFTKGIVQFRLPDGQIAKLRLTENEVSAIKDLRKILTTYTVYKSSSIPSFEKGSLGSSSGPVSILDQTESFTSKVGAFRKMSVLKKDGDLTEEAKKLLESLYGKPVNESIQKSIHIKLKEVNHVLSHLKSYLEKEHEKVSEAFNKIQGNRIGNIDRTLEKLQQKMSYLKKTLYQLENISLVDAFIGLISFTKFSEAENEKALESSFHQIENALAAYLTKAEKDIFPSNVPLIGPMLKSPVDRNLKIEDFVYMQEVIGSGIMNAVKKGEMASYGMFQESLVQKLLSLAIQEKGLSRVLDPNIIENNQIITVESNLFKNLSGAFKQENRLLHFDQMVVGGKELESVYSADASIFYKIPRSSTSLNSNIFVNYREDEDGRSSVSTTQTVYFNPSDSEDGATSESHSGRGSLTEGPIETEGGGGWI